MQQVEAGEVARKLAGCSVSGRPDSFLPLFVADYMADTSHLARDQHGAYLLLLMAYWRKGGPLPADDTRLANTAKATPAEWKRLRPVMLEFFAEVDGHWVNKRSDEEIAKAVARTNAKAEAGKRGAAKRWQTDGTAMPPPLAEAMTKNSSSPSPSQEFPNGNSKEGERASAPRPKAGRWPIDGVVSETWISKAETARADHKLPPIDLRLEAEKFANYWASKSGGSATKTDWERTWINWILKAETNGRSRSAAGQSRLSDHPLGIFGEIGDDLRKDAGAGG